MKIGAQLGLFLVTAFAMSAAMGMHDSVFNNFLAETFDMPATARGWLEFPRELPGFLVAAMTLVLGTLSITQMGLVATLVLAAGLMGLGLWGASSFWVMMGFMIMASAGLHLQMPVQAGLALSLGGKGRGGMRLGVLGVVGTVGSVLGSGLVWLLSRPESPHYRRWFVAAAALMAVAGALYTGLKSPPRTGPVVGYVWRRKYTIYYLLEFIYGARKQIFLTFGFWVLIREYGQSAAGIAALLTTASLLGLVVKPLSGWAVDRIGERAVMIADGLLVAVVCLGYGYARRLAPDPAWAYWLAAACFIGDNLLFALGTARAVYVSRLSESAHELTLTLAMGVSVNHIASMVIPAIGGTIWAFFGYERLFAGAAVLALGTSVVALWVPGRRA